MKKVINGVKCNEGEEENYMTIMAEWKDYFKWKANPNLGFIHTLDSDEFRDLYCDSTDLNELIERLIEYYFASQGRDNLVFYGNEGYGKTSFCYFLRKVVLSKKDLSDKYHIEILHVGSLMEGAQVNLETIYDRLHKMIRSLLAPDTRRKKDDNGNPIQLGINNAVLEGIEGVGDSSSKVNNLKNHMIKMTDKKCLKRLIIVLDDTDTYEYEVLKQVSETLFQVLGPRFFFKCISFRPSVWEALRREPTSFVHTWFYSSEEVIPPSLDEILERRFQVIGGYNFFDSDLCAIIQQLNSFDIKRSFDCIEKILFNLKPPVESIEAIEKEGVIRHIKNNFAKIVRILLSTNRMENLFLRENRFHRFLSVPKEILLFMKNYVTNASDEDLYNSFNLKFKGDYLVSNDAVRKALNHLIKQGYMYKMEDSYFLTSKGTVYCQLLKVPQIYNAKCISLIKDTQDELYGGRKNRDDRERREFSMKNHFE